MTIIIIWVLLAVVFIQMVIISIHRAEVEELTRDFKRLNEVVHDYLYCKK